MHRAAAFLFALAFGVGACSDHDEMLPPWHMWGNSETVTAFPLTAIGAFTNASTQLVRIAYGRPETWNFLFAMKVASSDLDSNPAGNWNLQVHYDLTIGVGRSQVTLVDFAVFNVTAPTNGFQRYCTQVQVPKINTTDTADNVIDSFVAQDIQLQTRTIVSNATVGTSMNVQVDAYFSPVNHIRPEWWKLDGGTEQFSGDEDKGK